MEIDLNGGKRRAHKGMRLQLGSAKPGVAKLTEAEILPVAVPIAFCSSTSYTSNVWVGSRYNCSHVASTCSQQREQARERQHKQPSYSGRHRPFGCQS